MRLFINLVAVFAFALMLLFQEAIAVERRVADASKRSDTIVDFNKPWIIDTEQSDAARKSTSRSDDGGPTAAAAPNLTIKTDVPERVRYLFDLHWCKKWHFECTTCEKEDQQFMCARKASDCEETYTHFECRKFNVSQECLRWNDGCNTCTRNSDGHTDCTLLACPGHQPWFTCQELRVR